MTTTARRTPAPRKTAAKAVGAAAADVVIGEPPLIFEYLGWDWDEVTTPDGYLLAYELSKKEPAE